MVTGPPPPTLGELERGLAAYLERFEAGQLSAGDAAVIGKRFGRIKRMAQGAEAICLARAAATSSVRRRGDADGAKWAGRQMGVSNGQAADLLKLAGRLDKAPRTKEALLGGGISAEVAAEVARTAEVAPEAEQDMLTMAGQESLGELKKRGRRVRAAAAGAEQRAARVQRERHLRTWIDDEDGSGRGSWKVPAADQAQLLAALEPMRERFFAEARRQGRHEPVEAYAADALVQLAADALAARQAGLTGERSGAAEAVDPEMPAEPVVPGVPSGQGIAPAGSEPGSQATSDGRVPGRVVMSEVVVRADHQALVRGRPTAGEVCEVLGTGPVPVADVRRWMAGGAFVAVVVTPFADPLDVRLVAHLGRRPAALAPLSCDAGADLCLVAATTDGDADAELRLPLPGASAHSPPADFRHVRVILHVAEEDLGAAELALLRVDVETRGVDVATLVHRGRRPNAVQRSALQWRSPECAVLGCANQARLEADHVVAWCVTGHTTLDELEHLCRAHHRMKTHDGYRLAPGCGKRAMFPPKASSPSPSPSPAAAPASAPSLSQTPSTPSPRASGSPQSPPSGSTASGPVAWRDPYAVVITRRCRGSTRRRGSAQFAGP